MEIHITDDDWQILYGAFEIKFRIAANDFFIKTQSTINQSLLIIYTTFFPHHLLFTGDKSPILIVRIR